MGIRPGPQGAGPDAETVSSMLERSASGLSARAQRLVTPVCGLALALLGAALPPSLAGADETRRPAAVMGWSGVY